MAVCWYHHRDTNSQYRKLFALISTIHLVTSVVRSLPLSTTNLPGNEDGSEDSLLQSGPRFYAAVSEDLSRVYADEDEPAVESLCQSGDYRIFCLAVDLYVPSGRFCCKGQTMVCAVESNSAYNKCKRISKITLRVLNNFQCKKCCK